VGGYALGVLGHGAIWLLSCSGRVPYVYEAPLPIEVLDRMRERLRVERVRSTSSLAIVSAFDHGLLDRSVHEWIQRRWQMMSTSINSSIGLIVAPILGVAIVGLRPDPWWGVGTLIAAVAFVFHAARMWIEVRDALEFQSFGPFPPRQRTARTKPGGPSR
jgi:hypothetical protein